MAVPLTVSETRVESSRTTRWALFGIANVIIVAALAISSWYLIADPVTSTWGLYPLPLNAFIFWAMLFIVFAGFLCEFAGFTRLPQPARGLAILACTVAFGIGVTWFLAAVVGSFVPTFSPEREGGVGYFAGALFVLFGFITWVMASLNWDGWPWRARGLKQPVAGLATIALLLVPTVLLYVIFGLPAVSAGNAEPAMDLSTVLGFFYSIVISVIFTGQTLENRPWLAISGGKPGALVATSIAGNVIVGTFLFMALKQLLPLLIGHASVAELGSAAAQFPAQIGVCWVLWMILWGNAFGNAPTRFGTGTNLVLRGLITFALGIITFLVYYKFLAGTVLHEPELVAGFHGDALGFIDWVVLWVLLYVVSFESFGIRRLKPAE